MEHRIDRIGNGQLLCLLILSQSFLLLNERGPMENGLLLLAVYAASALILLLLLHLFRRAGELHPVQNHLRLRGALWLICILYFVVTAHLLLDEVSVIFQGRFSPILVLLFLIVVVAATTAMGFEALCRGAFVLMFFFLAALLLLGIGSADQCTLLNLNLPETSGSSVLDSIGAKLPAAGAELLLFLLIQPLSVQPNALGRGAWVLAGFGISAALLILTSLSMGEYGKLTAYPLYALSRAADLSSTAGMTPVYWFMLLCAATVRLTALLTAAAYLRGAHKNHFPWVETVLALIGILLLMYSDTQILLLQRIAGAALLVTLIFWRFWPRKEKTR